MQSAALPKELIDKGGVSDVAADHPLGEPQDQREATIQKLSEQIEDLKAEIAEMQHPKLFDAAQERPKRAPRAIARAPKGGR